MSWLWWAIPSVFGGLFLVLVALYVWRRVSRVKHYAKLATDRQTLIDGRAPTLAGRDDLDERANEFSELNLARAEKFLEDESLRKLRDECLENVPNVVRSYIPKHKKGGTVSYEQIHQTAPACLAFYHSPEVQSFISRVVGEKIGPTADHDQSSLSMLVYNEAGDHLQWHFDHNFYKGRHFTVLLSLMNENENGGLSAGNLQRKPKGEKEIAVDTSPNVLVVFEGKKVLHRASPIAEGDRRMMLSMTYATSPRIGWFKDTIRRFKDTAYYGLRVIWD